MDAQTHEQIESILYDYACDTITAESAKVLILELGHKVNLRKWINNITAVESVLTGEITEIEV